MKAKITKDEFNALPEALRKEYKEQGDKYLLIVDSVDGWALEDVTGLRSALGKERDNATNATRELTQLREQFKDIDPTLARDALDKVGKMKDWLPDERVKETVKQNVQAARQEMQTKLDEANKSLQTVTSQLEAELIDARATKAISDAKGKVGLMLPHVKGRMKMAKDANGRYVVQVLDKSGNPAYSAKSGNGDPMPLAELLESFKTDPDFTSAFEASGSSGSGAGGPGAGAGANGVKYIRASDQDALNANLEGIAAGTVVVIDG